MGTPYKYFEKEFVGFHAYLNTWLDSDPCRRFGILGGEFGTDLYGYLLHRWRCYLHLQLVIDYCPGIT
jgi:hypothetical protein